MAMSALQQAMVSRQQLQGANQQGVPQQQAIPQSAIAPNALEQAFMQFLQQSHQGGAQYIKYLPWFNPQTQAQQSVPDPTQQQIGQTAQQAFEPPQQQSVATPQAGSGQALANQATQDQVNRGGDMSSRFSGSGYV